MKKILICGYGSIARKHAENLKGMNAAIRIWRKRSDLASEITAAGYEAAPDLADGLAWCDAVIIATATDEHMPIALAAADAGKPIYLEKPLSHNMDGVDALLHATRNLTVEVGCQLRHHPGLIHLRELLRAGTDGPVLAFQGWVGQRLDQWRPGTDYRQGYSADAARGGGALFDLVHEVDLVTWLVGPVANVQADLRKRSDLEMNAEDLANLILSTDNGTTGVLQLDMLSPAYRRGFSVICAQAVYNWDLKEGSLWRDAGHGREIAHKVQDDFKTADLLKMAVRHFMDRLDNPQIPASCSLAEAAHDLQILLAARKANTNGQRQSVSSVNESRKAG